MEINPELIKNGDLFSLIVFIKLVSSKKDYFYFLKALEILFEETAKKIKVIDFKEIIITMGFPDDWRLILD